MSETIQLNPTKVILLTALSAAMSAICFAPLSWNILVWIAVLLFGFIHPGSQLLLDHGLGVLEFVWAFVVIRLFLHIDLVTGQ